VCGTECGHGAQGTAMAHPSMPLTAVWYWDCEWDAMVKGLRVASGDYKLVRFRYFSRLACLS
jgi:hypothetical protein